MVFCKNIGSDTVYKAASIQAVENVTRKHNSLKYFLLMTYKYEDIFYN